MATSTRNKQRGAAQRAAARPAQAKRSTARPSREVAPGSPLGQMADDVRSLTGQVLNLGGAAAKGLRNVAATAAEGTAQVRQALGRARALTQAAEAMLFLAPAATTPEVWRKTGKLLHDLREKAGMTLAEVGQAVNLKDPELLAVVERGKAALPFEIVLRLAAVLGRNDPLAAAMALTRTASPQIWQTLESMGFGLLILQSAREREWVNVLRAEDSARSLSDEEFQRLLAFVKSAFDLAIDFKSSRRRSPR
jgi:transcriptional regulator with XRE-family HTH domain